MWDKEKCNKVIKELKDGGDWLKANQLKRGQNMEALQDLLNKYGFACKFPIDTLREFEHVQDFLFLDWVDSQPVKK